MCEIRYRICECLALLVPLMVTVLAFVAAMETPAAEPLALHPQIESIGIDGMAPLAVEPRAPPAI